MKYLKWHGLILLPDSVHQLINYGMGHAGSCPAWSKYISHIQYRTPKIALFHIQYLAQRIQELITYEAKNNFHELFEQLEVMFDFEKMCNFLGRPSFLGI